MLSWNTIYISGEGDFRDDVRRKLEYYLPEGSTMPGFLGALELAGTHDMYWVDVALPIRQIKEAIGAKLIWKHRLRFYHTLEAFLQAHQPQEDQEISTPPMAGISHKGAA